VLTELHDAVNPAPVTLESVTNVTFTNAVIDVMTGAVAYVPDSTASCRGVSQPTFVHSNTVTLSLPLSVLKSVNRIMMYCAPGGAMIQAQLALLL